VLLLTPASLFLFEAYAYYIQFQRFGLASVPTWIALALSLALIAYGTAIYLITPDR
jgi:uncharacterized membrane protein YczE